MKRALSITFVSLLLTFAAPAQSDAHQPIVLELITLLDARPDLHEELSKAIIAASVKDIGSVDAFYGYVDRLVTWIPDVRVAVPTVLALHYIVNQAPGDALNQDEDFSMWLNGVADARGAFLDAPASLPGIASFAAIPDFNIADYHRGPSGWQTFNQFFAREIRPGKRPIADPDDGSVIVAPADAVFMGAWPVNQNSTVTIKGTEWSIAQLLDGSPYADAFRGGVYMHSFLRIHDYHRYHTPIGGVVKEVRLIQGRVYLDVVRNPDGTLSSRNGDTYQFNQQRGFVVVESPEVGLVAIVPVGMSLISSVNLTPEIGTHLRKGAQFGYFMFGGSDIVMIFQDKGVVLEAEPGKKYLQGERIGRVDGK